MRKLLTEVEVFTQEEKQDVINTIDWIVTEWGDDADMLPTTLSEWIARLCINNVEDSVIYKVVERMDATDNAVRECIQAYLDNPDTQTYNTSEQNEKIKQSMQVDSDYWEWV